MAAVVLLVALPPLARAAGSIVTGVVNDALERPLADASVRLETSDGQVVRQTSTDRDGRFTFLDVPAGPYRIFAEREGFETATASAIVAGGAGWDVKIGRASCRERV